MKVDFSLGILATLLIFVCSMGLAAELHVSPDGDDKNPGTKKKPLRTLKESSARAKAGDTVILRGGVYRETLVASRSGTPKQPIVFAAAKGEKVVLTGTDLASGWKPYKDKIVQAKISKALDPGFNQVFLNESMLPMARFPNQNGQDLFRPTLTGMRASKSEIAASSLTQPDGFWNGGFVVGGFQQTWTFQCATIKDYKKGRLILSEKSGPWFTGKGEGYVAGVLGALDAPGEWHVQDNTLYLWPPEGTDLKTAKVEIKQRSLCIDFSGNSNIVVKGLTIRAGSVRMVGDQNLLEDCHITYPSHFTRFTWGGYSAHGGAEDGHQGILMEGDRNTLQRCKVQYSAGSGIVIKGLENVVTRCEITDIDYSGTYSCGITLRPAQGKPYGKNKIWFNTIKRMGRDCIQFYGALADDIRYNDISVAGLICHDMGILYGWGRDGQGTRIAYNWVYDNRTKDGPGIYLDNYCQNFLIDHNVIWNCQSGVRVNRPAKGHKIYNNTLFRCKNIGTHSYNQYPNHMPAYWKEGKFGDANQYDAANNLHYDPRATRKKLNQHVVDYKGKKFWPRPGSSLIDTGKPIEGITDGFVGKAPDRGAYEAGGPKWTAGVNGTSGKEK